MIRLQVEDYCQDCRDFEPFAEQNIIYANNALAMIETVVRCKNCEKCNSLCEHLKNHKNRPTRLMNPPEGCYVGKGL